MKAWAGMISLLTAAALWASAAGLTGYASGNVRAEGVSTGVNPAEIFPAVSEQMDEATGTAARESLQKEAEKIIPSVKCKGISRSNLHRMTDGDEYSYGTVGKAATLTLKTSVPVNRFYLRLENACRWKLIFPDGSEKKGGKNRFLHEYVEWERPVSEFSLSVPANTKITELCAFSVGKLPEWVQVWEPPCEKADLLILSTHADDEHLWFGGAMPYYAGELGYQVQVVYLTYHARQTYRGHELLNGLWTVGVRHYPVITDKFRDVIATKASLESAAAYFGREKVLQFQVEMLRRFSPKVVLGQDINGEYGHGAHKLNAATLLDALKIYDDPEKYPASAAQYGTGKVGKCYLHLWDRNTIVVSWSGKVLQQFGGKTAFEMACEGYRCHKSQLRWNNHVKESGKYDCRKFGLVYTTVGYDTPGVNDLFEHIDMSVGKQSPKKETAPVSVTVSEGDGKAPPEEHADGSWLSERNLKIAGSVMLILISVLVFGICLKRRGLIHKSPVSTE